MALQGWRKRGLSLGLGLLSAAALPPVYLIPVLLPAITGLIWLIVAQSTKKRAFFVGWWFGAGHFGAGLHWISNSLLVDAASHAWLIPFCILGFGAGFGLFTAVLALILRAAGYRFSRGRDGPAPPAAWAGAAFLFAGLWVGLEWVRSWLFTGFPWNLLGSVWGFSDAMLQPAAFAGVYGLSLLTVLAAASPVLFAADGGGRGPAIGGAAVLFMMAAWGGGGALRLASHDTAFADGIVLRLVQPNVRQADKWRRELRRGHVIRLLALSTERNPDAPSPTHVIWPETAVPFSLWNSPGLIRALRDAVPEGGALLTGAPRVEPRETGRAKVWNSLHAVTRDAGVTATHDKFHLVPFGEYVPFQEYLGFLRIASARGNYESGPGLRTLSLPGLPAAAPLICFEVIFPGKVVPGVYERPSWLLNITNDAWFGLSAGPHQHFVSAKLRAIEEGLPLVRVANTGISAVIDSVGREIAALPLGEGGFIDSRLPTPLKNETVFGVLGQAAAVFLSLMSLMTGLFLVSRS